MRETIIGIATALAEKYGLQQSSTPIKEWVYGEERRPDQPISPTDTHTVAAFFTQKAKENEALPYPNQLAIYGVEQRKYDPSTDGDKRERTYTIIVGVEGYLEDEILQSDHVEVNVDVKIPLLNHDRLMEDAITFTGFFTKLLV